jgi:hypothetical protein
MKSTFGNYMTFFSQARRTCGTTHFICPCTILHATGFGLPPYFEDWGNMKSVEMIYLYMYRKDKNCQISLVMMVDNNKLVKLERKYQDIYLKT